MQLLGYIDFRRAGGSRINEDFSLENDSEVALTQSQATYIVQF